LRIACQCWLMPASRCWLVAIINCDHRRTPVGRPGRRRPSHTTEAIRFRRGATADEAGTQSWSLVQWLRRAEQSQGKLGRLSRTCMVCRTDRLPSDSGGRQPAQYKAKAICEVPHENARLAELVECSTTLGVCSMRNPNPRESGTPGSTTDCSDRTDEFVLIGLPSVESVKSVVYLR
jgi:hypothetical protein